jgi:hypothetical protein
MATGYAYDSKFKFEAQVTFPANKPLPRRTVIVSPLPIPAGMEAFYIASEWRYFAPGAVFEKVDVIEMRTQIRPGELIDLLDDTGTQNHPNYAKIYRAAYPKGAGAEDDIALYFLEKVKNPVDGMIDVSEAYVTESLDHFITENYIEASDKERVLAGVIV